MSSGVVYQKGSLHPHIIGPYMLFNVTYQCNAQEVELCSDDIAIDESLLHFQPLCEPI